MEQLRLLKSAELARLTQTRAGEVKWGERMQTADPSDWKKSLRESDAPFVLLGIPEDIGVRANFGRPGAASTWSSVLTALVNVQHNRMAKGSLVMALGQLDVTEWQKQAEQLNPLHADDRKQLFEWVSAIDKELTHLVRLIIAAGKCPILVGGGHNNAYGAIKGTALAMAQPIHALNFDAHSDFRLREGRHSGNGFSYAMEEGFLKKYYVLGLHENYTSKQLFDHFKTIEDKLQFATYENLRIRHKQRFADAVQQAFQFLEGAPCGIEIDLDAISMTPSSAMSPCGFSAEEARRFVYAAGAHRQSCYLHICEGAANLGDPNNPQLIGKLISYLITDFIKGKRENT